MSERIDVSVEDLARDIHKNVVDIEDFNERVVGAYNDGTAEKGLEADDQIARSIIPAATGALRDFSYIAPDIPLFIAENCVGCMDCVTECPDTAILGKVIEPAALETKLGTIAYSRGLSRLMLFMFGAGLISTISVFPNAKTAEASGAPLPEKTACTNTSSPAFRTSS